MQPEVLRHPAHRGRGRCWWATRRPASRPRTPSNVNQDALAGLTKGDASERAAGHALGAGWPCADLVRHLVGVAPAQAARATLAAERLIRWTPYLVGVPVFLVLLYASFEAFSKVLPGAF